MEWVAPKSVDEVRFVMGLIGHYMSFIKNFLQITYPITSLQSKGMKFEWIEECENNFEKIKQFMTHAPILQSPDSDKEFRACIDAYKGGLHGVLIMLDKKVVCYESRKLNKHEKNYPMHGLQLEEIIHALNMWRHYILSRWFVFMSDNIGLRYFFDQLNINPRQAKW